MSQEKKQSLVSRITPAGWLALVVLTILLVGVVGNLVKAAVPYNRLQPITPQPTYTPTVAPTATPELDTDAAWETFMQVINKCDALADQGDDLSKYPATFEELQAGIEELTTDQNWINECNQNLMGARLVEFGPRNLTCKGTVCQAAVSASGKGALMYASAWQQFCKAHPESCNNSTEFPSEPAVFTVRPPKLTISNPFRLFKGTLEYQEGRWIVTKIQVDILPASPDSTATPQP